MMDAKDMVIVAADDKIRDQVMALGKKLKVDVISHDVGADACAVIYDGIEHATARNKNKIFFFISSDVNFDLLGRILK